MMTNFCASNSMISEPDNQYNHATDALPMHHSSRVRYQAASEAQPRTTKTPKTAIPIASANIGSQAGLGSTVTRSVPDAATISTARSRFNIAKCALILCPRDARSIAVCCARLDSRIGARSPGAQQAVEGEE